MSDVKRKPAFCIWENKGEDQLRGNKKLMEIINMFLKAQLLVCVVFRGRGNRRTWGKPLTMDRQPLPSSRSGFGLLNSNLWPYVLLISNY